MVTFYYDVGVISPEKAAGEKVVDTMELDDLLGIDPNSALTKRANSLLEVDRRLVRDLTARRKELGLTQAEVARRMDISQSAVARIESGQRDLHQSTIRRYAMAVEVRVEHKVIPDDPAHERSARLLGDLKGQMSDAFEVNWLRAPGAGESLKWSTRKAPAVIHSRECLNG